MLDVSGTQESPKMHGQIINVLGEIRAGRWTHADYWVVSLGESDQATRQSPGPLITDLPVRK
jgi:hypothetical protein